jgi:hypothetical protein
MWKKSKSVYTFWRHCILEAFGKYSDPLTFSTFWQRDRDRERERERDNDSGHWGCLLFFSTCSLSLFSATVTFCWVTLPKIHWCHGWACCHGNLPRCHRLRKCHDDTGKQTTQNQWHMSQTFRIYEGKPVWSGKRLAVWRLLVWSIPLRRLQH